MENAPRASECGIALIGQQFMGRAHSNAWGQASRFFSTPLAPVLRTLAARDEASLREFAPKWGWQSWTTDWRSLATDDRVHLVDVATPNDAHAEQAIAMLEAGKHVACEKPLARSLAEARAMLEVANRASTATPVSQRTFVWFNYRRCPAVALAHKLVREGALGRIAHVRATYLQSWGSAQTPMSWRFEKKRAGSGAHGDLNAHLIDLTRFITGEEIVDIHGAVARTFIAERTEPAPSNVPPASKRQTFPVDVDDAMLFLASLTGGGVASFEATRVATGRLNANSIEINGELASLRFEFEDMNVLQLYEGGKSGGAPRTDGWRRIMCTRASAHPYAANWWPDGHGLGYEHGFINMAADILRTLGGEQPEVPLPDFRDGYEVQRVLEAAMLAAQNRCAVPLAEVM